MQLRVGLVCILVAGVSPARLLAQSTGAFGDPLPGLSDDELERFDTGLDEFSEEESLEEGVGPIFNGRSCVECHSAPEVGGGADALETRFGTTKRGKFDDLDELGGSLIQAAGIGLEAECDPAVDFVGEVVPEQATITAERRATPLFGLGLVDAVPDSTIIALAKLQAHEHRSTAGTVSRVQSIALGRKVVGKFGWKAQNPTLFQFSGDAYVNELGITSP
jgi:hypothetical protein